jgi:hypothetical protein
MRTGKSTKDAGFSNFKAFLLLYGLRLETPAYGEHGDVVAEGAGAERE